MTPLFLGIALLGAPSAYAADPPSTREQPVLDVARENQRRLTRAGLLLLGGSVPVILLPLAIGALYQRRKQRRWEADEPKDPV